MKARVITEFSDLNIFQKNDANGREPGFWVRRTTWADSCARIVEVGPIAGPPPYFGNPKVYADIHNLASGELIEARAKLPVPGTYKTWRRIDPPEGAGR
ncbi:hypothetical protein [Sphingopyxis sp.]|uniref:hypothetical protein n=1 Tax=Sphingopyxis sp. TaxID=1908224 RepID=UPI0035AE3DF0